VDLQLKDKTALVTGASIGIGRAIAKGLALEGARIAVAARRRELLESLAQEIEAQGAQRPVLIVQDIMQEDAALRLRDAAMAPLGRVDILVNNAGGSRRLPVDAPDEKWDEALTLNFTRYRQVTHALLPQMVEGKWGRIINITGKSEPEGLNAAFAAKAAVHAWAKGLSREIGRYGITINSIPPGRIMSEQIRRNYPPDYRKHFAETEIPLGYWGEPEDLAVLAVFLASPLARYITGAVIPVDGGLRRYQF
jgi:3-oxoacyl-[acyl-carrier protein] reductase